MSVAEVFRKVRGGYPQEEIAAAAGIAQSYLSMIESGARIPSVPVIRSFGYAMGLHLDQIGELEIIADHARR